MPQQQPLSVREAPGFEDRWAVAKMILVGLMGLLVLAGLAGVFGRGPVSKGTATAPTSGALVTWERFAGRGTPGELSVELKSPTGRPQTTLVLDRAVADHLAVLGTRPRSSSETASEDGTAYGFQLGADGRGKIVLTVQPSKPGAVKGVLTLDGERIPIGFMVWP